MRSITTLTAAALLFGMPGVALADGPDWGSMKDDLPPAWSWTGVYVGVHGGYGWGDADITENLPTLGGLLPPSISDSYDVDGGFGGVQIGGLKQMGNFVLGAELSLSGADISGSGDDCFGIATLIAPLTPTTARCDTTVNWMATAIGKLGYAGNSWMVYGLAGWTIAGLDHEFRLNVPAVPLSLGFAQNDTADGFTVGGGFDYAITNSVSIGVEYQHTELESDGEGLLLGGLLTTGERDVDLDTVRARLNIKVGG